jgi:hypothetical protein
MNLEITIADFADAFTPARLAKKIIVQQNQFARTVAPGHTVKILLAIAIQFQDRTALLTEPSFSGTTQNEHSAGNLAE